MPVKLRLLIGSFVLFNHRNENNIVMYGIIVIIAVLLFILIYGVHVINPNYVNWLIIRTDDMAQHYIGWVAYRQGNWNFPIGLSNMLSYPNNISVIFTDSIPIFAVIFKILSPILPNDFQYFGFWGILCFILQGLISGKIIYEITKNKYATIIGSIYFIIFPVFIDRLFFYTALAGQWLILLALEPLLLYKKYEKSNKIYYLTALIAFLSSSIHIYLTAMCTMCIFAFCLTDIFYKKLKRSFIVISLYFTVCFYVFFHKQ